VLGQAQINENLTKKLASNDEIFENINSNLEGLNFSFKNQLSLNKMFETQLAQIAATIPTYDFEKIPWHPEISFENINMVITRDGRSTPYLSYPNHAGRAKNTGIQPHTMGFELAWGRTPHKATCILHSHHLLLPCIKTNK